MDGKPTRSRRRPQTRSCKMWVISGSHRVAKGYYLLTNEFFDNRQWREVFETYCHFNSRYRLEGLPAAGGWCGLDRGHITAVAKNCLLLWQKYPKPLGGHDGLALGDALFARLVRSLLTQPMPPGDGLRSLFPPIGVLALIAAYTDQGSIPTGRVAPFHASTSE